MVQLEELIEAAASKYNFSDSNAQTSGTPSQDGSGVPLPDLPPERKATTGKTADELWAELNKSPLFMTELEDNDDVAALQALAYEGTPLENASDFKERGNECFREKKWSDAREFYDKGVAILTAEERRRAKGEPPRAREPEDPPGSDDDPDEVARQRGVLESTYVNRAACQLELRNFRSCTLDCAAALKLNRRNVKALYRSARALLALGRADEAADACALGLDAEPANGALLALARDVERKAAEVRERRRREEERAAREKRRAALLKAALAARAIRTRRTEQPPEMEDARVRLAPDEDDPRSTLEFPAVLLYPAHLQSDFVKAFGEAEALEAHLSYILPPPWDARGEYTPAGVECYMETVAGGLVKMGKKVPLLTVLSGGKVEVVDDVVRIFVLPKARAEGWVQEFKAKKAAEKKT
ncbi:uncharacterized protein E0L32_011389 [Thyridium curvatum]|uniref:Cns1/TTC4 wheel domain-containing protein n=1 Tax=Thyridium curvatum TaxID=1093900 RepID=A0A507BNQ2_9PEZI|nr:uncharacterized protein E0L32_011389 [Thyridium curvatum]TPX18911.1 hypothetical protein E0L32_011389 [Thyridium curvatum]